MHASKNAHLSSLREIQADFVKGVVPSAPARPGSTPSGSSADTSGGATANAVDATAATDEEAGEGELGATAVAVVAGSETGQAKRAAAALDQEVQRLQARLVTREEALATGEEEVLQLRAERVATRAELTQVEASMLSVMEELARKAQALSAVQQHFKECPLKSTTARHPCLLGLAWGGTLYCGGATVPLRSQREAEARTPASARVADFVAFSTQVQAELHEARAVAQHLRAGESAWQEQRLMAEAAQEEAVAVAAREKADAEVARARAVSELEDLLSYETAARELDRREVASLLSLDTY